MSILHICKKFNIHQCPFLTLARTSMIHQCPFSTFARTSILHQCWFFTFAKTSKDIQIKLVIPLGNTIIFISLHHRPQHNKIWLHLKPHFNIFCPTNQYMVYSILGLYDTWALKHNLMRKWEKGMSLKID
jgi:hypothetical protein